MQIVLSDEELNEIIENIVQFYLDNDKSGLRFYLRDLLDG